MDNQRSLAAITLLRHMADRLEKGEVMVYSLAEYILTDQGPDHDYTLLPIRTRLEIVTYPASTCKTKADS